jgi:hypothetical protein
VFDSKSLRIRRQFSLQSGSIFGLPAVGHCLLSAFALQSEVHATL